jgi:rfaE bifunctional protein nucleotidyltransferase chain/domain
MRDKIKTREELARLCEDFRKQGREVGFTSGVFDLIHAGHIDYLEKAKKICDVLIVGINSDASVKRFKGRNRPVLPERERARVVAGFEAVDYVFVFNERRNKRNIEFLKPRYYIKAGDYSKEGLTSAKIVEKLGGEVKLIETSFDTSTTGIIEKIRGEGAVPASRAEEIVEEEGTVHFPRPALKSSPAVFVDRDGTVNEDILYLHEPDQMKILPNAVEGIKKMQDMGYRIIIVTNQAGIGLGYFSKEDFYRVNSKMLRELSSAGISVSRICFCPHGKEEGCECRKPGIALITRACSDLNLDMSRSYFIGDQTSDIEAGRRAGLKTILMRTGFGGSDKQFDVKPDYVADDLLDAADYILRG